MSATASNSNVGINGSSARFIRTVAGLPQGAVAEQLGVSQSLLSMFEHGQRSIRPELADMLVHIYAAALEARDE